MIACRHLGKKTALTDKGFGNEDEFLCKHPSESKKNEVTTMAICMGCCSFLNIPDPEPARAKPTNPDECRHPLGTIVDRYGRDAGLADLFRGASAFLVLGGPSLRRMPLELLGQRGILILSVNNCPGGLPTGIRPHVWLHTDPARKFHDSIWRDPGIPLKIVPVREWGVGRAAKRALRHRENGELVKIQPLVSAKDMPGLFGFHRNTTFDPPNWLYEATINRGNDEKSATGMKNGKKIGEPNGWPNVINTMFSAVRLAFYLGIYKLYLLGADFRMSEDEPYAFNQDKHCGGVRGNNNSYAKLCCMFDGLKPHFDAAKPPFKVFNCTPDSGLWTFPYVEFEKVVKSITSKFEKELDCNGWYNPIEPPKPSPAGN